MWWEKACDILLNGKGKIQKCIFNYNWYSSNFYFMALISLSYISVYLSICFFCCSAKSYPTLWNLVDSSLPGHPVHEISQARILEWVAISSSRGSSWSSDWTWSSALAGRFFTTEPPGKLMKCVYGWVCVFVCVCVCVCVCMYTHLFYCGKKTEYTKKTYR